MSMIDREQRLVSGVHCCQCGLHATMDHLKPAHLTPARLIPNHCRAENVCFSYVYDTSHKYDVDSIKISIIYFRLPEYKSIADCYASKVFVTGCCCREGTGSVKSA